MGADRAKGVMNGRQHLLRAYQHIVVPEPQHATAVFMQPLRARNVARGIEVLTAIDFNNQLGFEASKIHNIWTDRKLTPKPETKKLSTPQIMP